jgi:uracil-DNA glycosylase
LLKFQRQLRGPGPKLSPCDFEAFVRDEHVYLGNALLCYRTGWAETGSKNLSWRSFRHCQGHLARHVAAVRPNTLVTFGKNSCAAVSRIGTALDPADKETVALLRKVDREGSLKKVMEDHHRRRGPKRIRLGVGGRDVSFFPLCHPSLPNRYEGDYDALRNALGLPSPREQRR